MLSSSIKVPCSIESAPSAQRQVDAVGAMGVDRDPLAVEMRGLDHRPRLVLEHLRAEAEADAAVDAAGGGDLDDVDAARDLAPHRAAAIVGAVAGAADRRSSSSWNSSRTPSVGSMWPVVAEMRGAGIDDARPDRPAAVDRVAQAEGDAVLASRGCGPW